LYEAVILQGLSLIIFISKFIDRIFVAVLGRLLECEFIEFGEVDLSRCVPDHYLLPARHAIFDLDLRDPCILQALHVHTQRELLPRLTDHLPRMNRHVDVEGAGEGAEEGT